MCVGECNCSSTELTERLLTAPIHHIVCAFRVSLLVYFLLFPVFYFLPFLFLKNKRIDLEFEV